MSVNKLYFCNTLFIIYIYVTMVFRFTKSHRCVKIVYKQIQGLRQFISFFFGFRIIRTEEETDRQCLTNRQNRST